jgi:hypothetical protein
MLRSPSTLHVKARIDLEARARRQRHVVEVE